MRTWADEVAPICLKHWLNIINRQKSKISTVKCKPSLQNVEVFVWLDKHLAVPSCFMDVDYGHTPNVYRRISGPFIFVFTVLGLPRYQLEYVLPMKYNEEESKNWHQVFRTFTPNKVEFHHKTEKRTCNARTLFFEQVMHVVHDLFEGSMKQHRSNDSR